MSFRQPHWRGRSTFDALLHHVNEDCLRNAFFNLRFAKFGLKLHESKTRLIEFGKYAAERRERRGEGRPETFDFLGFTHKCARTRTTGWTWERMQRLVRLHLPRLRVTHPLYVEFRYPHRPSFMAD